MLLVALCYFATSDSNNNLPEALMEDASAHRFADQGPPGADTARVQQKVIADYWNWKISPEEQMQKALDKFEKILRDLVEVKVKLECVSNCVSEAGNNATSSGGGGGYHRSWGDWGTQKHDRRQPDTNCSVSCCLRDQRHRG